MQKVIFSPEQTPRQILKTIVHGFATSERTSGLDSDWTMVSLSLPPTESMLDALPFGAPLRKSGSLHWLGNPSALTRSALSATYEVGPDDEYTKRARKYWMLDTVRANYRRHMTDSKIEAIELRNVPMVEAVGLIAVTGHLLGLKEGAVRDTLTEVLHRKPETGTMLPLVHAAFQGLNRPDDFRLF